LQIHYNAFDPTPEKIHNRALISHLPIQFLPSLMRSRLNLPLVIFFHSSSSSSHPSFPSLALSLPALPSSASVS